MGFDKDITKETIPIKSSLKNDISLVDKMEIAGKISGNIAHSFNNKLSSILGFAELALRDVATPEKSKKYLNNVINGCEQAGKLIQNLLSFSSKQTLNYTPVDLNNVIHNSIIYLHNSIGDEIEVITDLGYELPQINADPVALDIILSQLCLNAGDAMPKGGELYFETSLVELDDTFCSRFTNCNSGKYICMSVTDTGTGIRPSDFQRIFEPFFSTKNPAAHPGLGLSVVYGLVRQHSGIIELDNPEEGGSRFKIYFPVSQVQDAASDPYQTPLQGGTETIMIVEDEDDLLQIMQTILGQYGYKVLTASNGKEALETIDKLPEKVQMVISDIIMPEMNGLDLYRYVMERRPDLPFIFITGYTTEFIIRAEDTGEFTELLQKPFKMNDLAVKVRSMLDRKKQN